MTPGRTPPGRRGGPLPRRREDRPEGQHPGYRALRRDVLKVLEKPGVIRQISPGFYFQRCLQIWEESLQSTRKDKTAALRPLEQMPGPADRPLGEPDLYRALLARQARSFALLGGVSTGVELRLRNIAPFVTGIGQPHPLENGFAFLKPYGVPYLAGSGVKGAVRAACAKIWEGTYHSESKSLLLHYFGSEDKKVKPAEKVTHRRGALVFLDVFPDVTNWDDVFRLDIVNPHYGLYYRGEDVPADWHQPVPSYFLTVRADLDWRLRILYLPADPFQRRSGWQAEIAEGLGVAVKDEGLGAKKSWGYGLFSVEEVAPADEALSALLSRSGTLGAPAEPSRPEDTHGPAPGSTGLSPEAAAVSQAIRSLRPADVKPRLAGLVSQIERCPVEERPALAGELREQIRKLGFKGKEIREFERKHSLLRSGAGQ